MEQESFSATIAVASNSVSRNFVRDRILCKRGRGEFLEEVQGHIQFLSGGTPETESQMIFTP